MNLRLALYHWIARHRLDRARGRALLATAGLRSEPPALARRFWPAVAVTGAALAGFGLVLSLAQNWDQLGRMARFALLQGVVLATCAGAALQPRARPALALAALLAIGGLFAYFGQTYQTGADPWQLFALWTLLALPLCLGARSDVLWTPWVMVAMVGIALWAHAHGGHRWSVSSQQLAVHAIAWVASAALAALLSPPAARYTGAGLLALRTAGTLALAMVVASALGALFQRPVAAHYPLALLLLAAAALALSLRAWFDLFLLSAVALALNVLLVAGLARLFFDHGTGDPLLRLLAVGLVAALLLAGSVHLVLRMVRRHG